MKDGENTATVEEVITITVRGWFAVNNRLSEIEAEAAAEPHKIKVIRRELLSGTVVGRGRLEVKVRYSFECHEHVAAVQILTH